MADLTVVQQPSIGPNDDWVVYDLGRPNWSPAWVPDLTTASGTREISDEERLDIVILGDGYTSKTTFEGDLADWISDLFELEVFEWFRGAVRIRAVYTESDEEASADRDSFYRVELTDSEDGISFSGWTEDAGADNEHFRDRIWQVLDALGVNSTSYPDDLDPDDTLKLNNTFSHLAVALMVRSVESSGPSGRAVTVPVGPDGERVKIGIANNKIHEICHAFAYLSDEYIKPRGSTSSGSNPDRPGLYNINNLCFSDTVEGCWWTHLSPCGDFARATGVKGPPPVVGWLWRGGGKEHGVWHCEHRCLMNGTHENYCHDPDDGAEPLDDDGKGADLRIRYRFCMWCQELVAMRFLEKTGELRESGDPDAPTADLGETYWERWKTTWRRRYYERFGIEQQIAEREADYAAWPTSDACDGAAAIWTSELYTVQKDSGPESSASRAIEIATLLPNL